MKQIAIVSRYTEIMRQHCMLWRKYVTEHASVPKWLPLQYVEGSLHRLENMFVLLEHVAAYNTENPLEIYPVASGYPTSYYLEYFWHTLKNSKDAVNISLLKRQFLDLLMKTGESSATLLSHIAQQTAIKLAAESPYFRQFVMQVCTDVESTSGAKAAVAMWESWSLRGVPVVYAMLFEYRDKKKCNHLAEMLRLEMDNIPKLAEMARAIDRAFADVHPKWLGRFIFGPVYIAGITKDENPIQHALNKISQEHASASRIIYEYVIAKGEEETKFLIDSIGKPHVTLQEFAHAVFDDEAYMRGATYVDKRLFVPHAAAQLIDESYWREINYKHTII